MMTWNGIINVASKKTNSDAPAEESDPGEARTPARQHSRLLTPQRPWSRWSLLRNQVPNGADAQARG